LAHAVLAHSQEPLPVNLPALSDANRFSVKILITDLDLAFTFLQVARTSTNPATRQRNRENANKVYDAVRHFLPRLRPTAEERQAIEGKMSSLKAQLQALGEVV
jgi:hypothetical protein